MANITFKLRNPKANDPQMIFLIYRFGRNEKLAYSTKLKVAPKFWHFEKMRVRNMIEAIGRDIINESLNNIQTAAETFIMETIAQGEQITIDNLRTFLDELTGKTKIHQINNFSDFVKDYLEKNKERINPKTGRVISYKVQREHERTFFFLNEYEKHKRNGKALNFDDITVDFHSDFTKYLQSCDLSANTIAHKIQTIKTWLNNATERGLNSNNQFKSQYFKASTEQTQSVYLSNKELLQLHNTEYNNERLTRVKDLFLIGACTGLRFSDFTRITEANINKITDTLTIEQQKTNERVTIPLHPIFKQIWKKYNNSLPTSISNQKFNEYIKEVCKLANITEPTQKHITKGGLRICQTLPKHEFISSHTARRSFATNLYLSGFASKSIMQITGHKTEKAFNAYIRVTSEQHANLLRNHWAENGNFLSAAK